MPWAASQFRSISSRRVLGGRPSVPGSGKEPGHQPLWWRWFARVGALMDTGPVPWPFMREHPVPAGCRRRSGPVSVASAACRRRSCRGGVAAHVHHHGFPHVRAGCRNSRCGSRWPVPMAVGRHPGQHQGGRRPASPEAGGPPSPGPARRQSPLRANTPLPGPCAANMASAPITIATALQSVALTTSDFLFFYSFDKISL